MTTLKIGETEIRLRLNSRAFMHLMEEFGDWQSMMDGLTKEENFGKRIGNIVTVTAVLAEGAKEEEVTKDWLGENTEPGDANTMLIAIMAEAARAMHMETEEKENRAKDRDLVLEEIERKKGEEASAGES